MRSGRIKIKRYKTGKSKGLILLLPLMLVIAAGIFLSRQGYITLPSLGTPHLSKEDMQMETRVLTLEGASHFALQLGAFSEKSGADALAESYKKRGAAGYIYHQEGYRVLAAAYETRSDAQAVQERLSRDHNVDAYLYPLTRSQITLRLTGQKAQLDALSDAFDLCIQLTSSLSRLSQALDEGAMTPEQVGEALRSQQNTLSTLKARMLSLFEQGEHPAVSALARLMEDMNIHLSNAMASGTATRLGSQVKYCQLMLLCQLEDYVNSLSP